MKNNEKRSEEALGLLKSINAKIDILIGISFPEDKVIGRTVNEKAFNLKEVGLSNDSIAIVLGVAPKTAGEYVSAGKKESKDTKRGKV